MRSFKLWRVLMLAFFAGRVSAHCGNFPEKGFDGTEESRYAGLVINPNYAYALAVPGGLVGHSFAPPSPYHGFGIVLSWSPRAYIYFDGSYNASMASDLDELSELYIQWLRSEATNLVSLSKSKAMLGSLPAIRQVVIQNCKSSNEIFVTDEVLAMRPSADMYYTAALLTTKSRYPHDKIVFEKMLRTWHLTPLYPKQKKLNGEHLTSRSRWTASLLLKSSVRPFNCCPHATVENPMIFAEMEYTVDHWRFHEELKEFLRNHFSRLESGVQGDSWFWIFDGEQKVAIDTFSSLKHQVKSDIAGDHVQSVINALQLKYKVKVYPEPKLEGHEEV